MIRHHTYDYEGFVVLCLEYENGWTVEIRETDENHSLTGRTWRDMDRIYATKEKARAAGVEYGKQRYG